VSGTIESPTRADAVYRLDGDLANAVRLIGVVMVAFGVVLSAFFLWILSGPDTRELDLLVGLLPAIILVPLALAVFATVASIQLRVGPRGAEFRALRYRTSATWAEITGWSIVSMGPFSGRGLPVRGEDQPVVPWWAILSGRLPLVGRAIPIAPFAIPLERSRLQADLERYAAWLFGASDAA
jgi:hypothetical protein